MPEKIDPITLEVIHHRLKSIADEMEDSLLKSSFSIIVKEARDATTAIFDAKGRNIAQTCAIPNHLGNLILAIPEILKYFPLKEAQDGDVYLSNDPYAGGAHLPDVVLMVPVIYQGEPIAIAVSMVHHGDTGGIRPGIATSATSLFHEGICLPPLKFYDAGKPVTVVHDIIRKNVRTPHAMLGDLGAQVSAGNVGKVRIMELFDEYGKELVLAAMEQLLDHSEALTRDELRKIPEGTYSFVDYIDNDGIELDKRIRIQAAVTIKDSDLIIDFTDSSPQVKGPLNCTPSATYAAAAYMLKVITGGSAIPTNDGCYRVIKLILPEGTIVNPRPPGATGVRTTTVHVLTSALIGALSKVIPERLLAGTGASGPYIYFGGTDPLTGKEYITNEIGMAGLGARPMKDGIDVVSSDIVNILDVPIESLELGSPWMVLENALYEGSGGAGEYRGGLGLKKAFRLTRGSGSATFRGERFYVSTWGLFGGFPGCRGSGFVIRNEEKEDIPSKRDYDLNQGDEIHSVSSGGGGFGDPLKRKPESVLQDVLDGRVFLDQAADEYGVVIDENTMSINQKKTNKLREEKTRLRGPITWLYDKGADGKE